MRRRDLIGGIAAGAALVITPTIARAAADDEKVNIDRARRFYSEFNTSRDAEQAREFISPDYMPADPQRASGIDAYVARMTDYFGQIDELLTDYAWIEEAVIASGNVVAWKGREKGTTTSGKLTDISNVTWFEFGDDGLIVGFWGGPDIASLQEQLIG